MLTCALDSTLVYDVPYASSASYSHSAGRLSHATNQNTTIAFGYDEDGSIVRRDQWLQGIAGGFGSLSMGRAWPPVSRRRSRARATRPPRTRREGPCSSRAAGRRTGRRPARRRPAHTAQLGAASLDDGLVTQGWTYGSGSALLSTQTVRFGATGPLVYSAGGMTYRGTNLTGFTDHLSSTTYGYWDSNVGRLVAAKATPAGGSQLAQNSLVCVTYGATKAYGPGPSFGNIERTREGVSAPFTRDFNYSGTNVEASTPPPHLGGPDAPTSVGATALGYDDYGRVVSSWGAEPVNMNETTWC